MIRIFLTLICCLFAVPAFSYDEEAKEEIFLSTPEQVAALSSEPGFLVGGIVSPLSGSPTLRQTDFIVKGAHTFLLTCRLNWGGIKNRVIGFLRDRPSGFQKLYIV